MKLKTQQRFFQIQTERLNQETRTVDLSFSSEEPYYRFWGTEILVHEKNAADLSRLNNGGPLLFNHNRDDVIGVVQNAIIGPDKRGHATVRFANTPRADEIFGMVKDKILANVSIAYRILTAEEQPKNIFRVTEWQPLEISIVTIPADITVGVGRENDAEMEVRMVRADDKPAKLAEHKGNEMGNEATAAAGEHADVTVQDPPVKQPTALEMEQARKGGIINLCKANKIDGRIQDHWIATGVGLDAVAEDMLRIMEERGRTNPQSVTQLGLSQKETRQFSLTRAITACADKNWNNAGFELECSREIAKRLNVVPDPHKFYVPLDVQRRSTPTPIEALAYSLMKRDLTVGVAGAGGFLVSTDNVGFIELLRNRSVAMNMGARRLTGLVGSVTVPRQSAAATAVWLANEASTITESQQTFVQMALTPKTVGAYTEVSRQLLLQSDPSAEGLVMADLAAVTALAVDLAALNGSGASGQPTGIINTAGIGSVTGTSLAYAGIVEFQTDVAAANIMGTGYVTTPAVAGLLKQRVKFTSTASPIWEGRLENGFVDGYMSMSSNQVPSANMIYGDWSQLVLAEWGVLEVDVNPFANFQAAIVGVRAIYSIDVGVRYPAAFSLATSIT